MILLALESAVSACSVAVCDGAGRVLVERRDAPGAGQADRLIELVDAAVGMAGVGYPDLDGVVDRLARLQADDARALAISDAGPAVAARYNRDAFDAAWIDRFRKLLGEEPSA